MSKVIPLKKNEIGRVKSLDFNSLMQGEESGLWASEYKAIVDNMTIKGYFFEEDWVFIILDLVASEISNSEMYVYRQEMREGKNISVKVEDHPLSVMMQQPNQYQDYSTWMYLHAVEVDLMGNGIQWFAENTMQMIILPADLTQIEFKDNGDIRHYLVHHNAQDWINGAMDATVFSVEDILHQRRPNPSNMIWGLSPFVPNRKSILFNRYTQDYLNSFYLKGATPQMALHMEKNASEDSALRMLKSFEQSYTGRRNQRRTLVLPKGVKADTISHSIGDQKLADIANLNLEKILNILRVPKHALSLARAGSLGSEEHKMALKFFHTSAINPQKKKIAGAFTAFFRKRGLLKETEFFAFDNSNVEILKEDEIKRADLAKKQMGVKTVNEIRETLYNLPPLPGGDVVILGPGQFAGESPNLTVNSNPTEPEAPEAEEAPEEEEGGEKMVKTLLATKYKTWWEKNKKAIDDELAEKEASLLEVNLDLFAQTTEKIAQVVKDVLTVKSKDEEDDLKKIEEAIDKIFSDLKSQYQQKYNGTLRSTVELGYNVNLESVFNEQARDTIRVLQSRGRSQRRALLEARGINAFAKISATSTEAIMQIIESGVAKNARPTDIVREIVNSPKTGITSFDRAEKIARTETLTAISIGKYAVMQDAEKVIPNLKKVWITANDERVRETHTLNGRQGPIDSKKRFKNGLLYPRDIAGEPQEVIRCRCDLLMVPPEDLNSTQIPEV